MQNEITFPESVAGENVTVRRATWKTHGNPTKAWYFGVINTPEASKGRLVLISTAQGLIQLKDAESGAHIQATGFASKFWLAEYTDDIDAPDYKDEPTAGNTDEQNDELAVKAEAKMAQDEQDAKPAKSAKVAAPCACQCGGTTKPGKMFIQGHDAKFSAKLFAEVAKNRIEPMDAVELMARYSQPLAFKLRDRITKSIAAGK